MPQHRVKPIPLKNMFLQLVKSLLALMYGWIAAVLPFAVPALVAYPFDAFPLAVLAFALFTGTLVVPCWFVFALPLFLFLKPGSDFWRYPVCVPLGAVVGLILSLTFFHAFRAGSPVGDPDEAARPALWVAWQVSLSGIASGAVTLAVMSWMNHDRNRKLGRQVVHG